MFLFKKKDDVNIKAYEITKTFFANAILNNPGISLDKSILLFENANCLSLDVYARRKGRTKRMYYDSYKNIFYDSKEHVIRQQLKIEAFIRNKKFRK